MVIWGIDAPKKQALGQKPRIICKPLIFGGKIIVDVQKRWLG